MDIVRKWSQNSHKQVGIVSLSVGLWNYFLCEVLLNFKKELINSAIMIFDIPLLLQQDNARPHTTAYTLD